MEEYNINKAKITMEEGRTIEKISEIFNDMCAKETIPLLEDTLWANASVFAPDICYFGKRSTRIKSPCEHTFVHGTGAIGINTIWSLCEPLFVRKKVYSHMTSGSLTSMVENIEKEIDHSMIFLSEFFTKDITLINNVKALIEENELVAARSYSKGTFSKTTLINAKPAFYIGCNSIPKILDNPFLSRFDNFYQIRGSKPIYNEIIQLQINTLGNLSNFRNMKTFKEISEYKNVFFYLKAVHDMKEKLSTKKYTSIFVNFENQQEHFEQAKNALLAKYDIVYSLLPRDFEIGYRRANASAWLNCLNRNITVVNECLVIEAQQEDIDNAIKSIEKSLDAKHKFFEWRYNLQKEMYQGRKKSKEKEYYILNYQQLKAKPFREQADEMKKAGFSTSHSTLSQWSKEMEGIGI